MTHHLAVISLLLVCDSYSLTVRVVEGSVAVISFQPMDLSCPHGADKHKLSSELHITFHRWIPPGNIPQTIHSAVLFFHADYFIGL